MSDLLKEAIADAKAVRETALQNAKAALEEAFTPQLKSMLSAKLREDEHEDEEEMDMDDLEDVPSDEVPVDDTDGDMVPDDDEEGDEEAEEGAHEGHGYGEAGEMEEGPIGAGLGAAIPGYVMGDMNTAVAAGIGAAVGDALTDGEEPSEEGMHDGMHESNLDLDAVIAELEEELGEGAHEADEAEEGYHEDDEAEEGMHEESEPVEEGDEIEEEYEIDESALEEDEELTAEDIEKLYHLAGHSMNELAEYKQAVHFLKDKLHEVNILNAKLLYTNKLFREFSLDNNQKLKIVENFDRAQTTREIKLVFSTIAEQLNENVGIPKRKPIKESASAPVSSTKPSKESQKVITEEEEVANRFKKLAGLIKG